MVGRVKGHLILLLSNQMRSALKRFLKPVDCLRSGWFADQGSGEESVSGKFQVRFLWSR
jgi:hypothetical protein